MPLNRDLLAGTLLAGIGLMVALVLIPEGVVEPRKVKYAALSPSYYPRIIAIALIGLGIAVSAKSILSPTKATEAADRHPKALLRVAAVFALLIAYAASITWLGFILASALALCGALVLAGERRPHVVAPIALVVPVALHFFFLKVARIPIPAGVLEPVLRGI